MYIKLSFMRLCLSTTSRCPLFTPAVRLHLVTLIYLSCYFLASGYQCVDICFKLSILRTKLTVTSVLLRLFVLL